MNDTMTAEEIARLKRLRTQLREECVWVDARKTLSSDAADRRNLTRRRDAVIREIITVTSTLKLAGFNEV